LRSEEIEILCETGEADKASKKIKEYRNDFGTNSKMFYYMGMQALAAGQIEQAKTWYKKGL